MKPSNNVNKLGVTGALTLTKRLSEMRMRTKTMKMTRERKLLPSRLGSAQPLLTCSSESFFSAKERQKPSTMTK